MADQKILVTSALPYANGAIHLGQLAGAYLPADIYVRYQRAKGRDVLYICGSDEHGVPITITADKEGITPKEVIERYHTMNKQSFEQLGVSFDMYARTSLPIHHETAAEFFLEYYNRGILVEKKSMQFFDEKKSMFLPDRYVEGTCPKCGFDNARSDECENCGALYDPSELKNPVSKISGTAPILKETAHYFFPFGNYQERLEAYVREMNEKYGWKENVLQYCKGWFTDKLNDRAVTRDLDWGVKVPLENSEGKVLYVWIEAVLGYVSAAKELSRLKGEPDLWKKFWHDPETKYVAFIGKDNIVFHCIIFPAMLMAWNDGGREKFLLPQNVPANEFLNYEGKKFSKSRKWGMEVAEYLRILPVDPLRYALASNLPEMRDTDFSWSDYQARNNNELADILGNFVNRTLTFIHKNFEGKIPPLVNPSAIDEVMLQALAEYPQKIGDLIERYRMKDATLEMMNMARKANKYFDESEPWKLVKTDKAACGTTMHICLKTIFSLAQIFSPVIPFTADAIYDMLALKPVAWDETAGFALPENHALNMPRILFQKLEEGAIDKILSDLHTSDPKVTAEQTVPKNDLKATITYDVFDKIDLRVATVIHAERVPKSKKLLKVQVDLGFEKRQVVAGIAQTYSPEELLNKKVVIVANLAPAKLMGQESQGMILAVESEDGKLNVLDVPSAVSNGTNVK